MIGLLGLVALGSAVAMGVSWVVNGPKAATAAAGGGRDPARGDVPAPEDTLDAAAEADAPVILDTPVKVSSLSLACAIGGSVVYPPLSLLSIAGLAWLAVPIWRDAYTSLFEERRVRMSVVDAVVLPAALATGHLVAAAFGYGVIFVGRNLLRRTESTSRDDLLHLYDQPHTTVRRLGPGGASEVVAIVALEPGDRIVLVSGEAVPVDGVVVEGYGRVDQRALTGESQPVDRIEGESVLASTLLVEGRLVVRVEQAGPDTVAAHITRMLAETVDFKSSVQAKGEAFGDAAALPLLGLSAVALPFAGASSALAVLFAPLMGTIRLAAPLGVLSHLSLASSAGILVRDGRALELLGDVDTIIFDKTGTLTLDRLRLAAITVVTPGTEDALLALVASAEQGQSHPIARALIGAARERGLALSTVDEARVELGRGLDVRVDGRRVQLGSERFMATIVDAPMPTALDVARASAAEEGASVVYAAVDGQIVAALTLIPTLRPEAATTIERLRAAGYRVLILSGDHEAPTRRLASLLAVDGYFSETLPEGKADVITQLQDEGRTVCFVGDGINDAIALKRAQVSVSMNDATRVASDTAQVVLTHDRLDQLVELIEISKGYATNMRRTVASAVVPSVVCIGGAMFGQVGLLGAIGLYSASLGAGLINASHPSRRALPLAHEES